MAPVTSTTISVRLFARYADLFKASELSISAEGIRTVRDVLQRIAALPGGAELVGSALVAVNLVQARPDTPVSASDEIALLPPLAGG